MATEEGHSLLGGGIAEHDRVGAGMATAAPYLLIRRTRAQALA